MNPFQRADPDKYPRLRDTIIYFCDLGKDKLGKTKLMKLLYYADFGYYAQHSRPFTDEGVVYRKYPRGPMSDEARYVLEELVRRDVLDRKIEDVYGYSQQSHIPIDGAAPASVLRPEDYVHLEKVWAKWQAYTTSQIVSQTHSEPPWNAVDMYEDIPYHMAYFMEPM